MISNRTFKLLDRILRFGYFLKLIPWQWNRKSFRLLPPNPKSKEYRDFKRFAKFHILCRIIAMIYYGVSCAFFDIPIYEKMPGLGVLAFLTLTILLIYNVLNPFTQATIWKLANGFVLFNEVQMKFYKRKRKQIKTDSAAKFGFIFVFFAIIATISAFPISLIILKMGLKISWLPRLLYFPGFYHIFAFGSSCFFLVDCYLYALVAFIVYIYGNVTTNWLAENIWQKPFTPIVVKRKLRIFYRGHEIYQTYTEVVASNLLPIAAILVCTMLITACYCLIDSWQYLHELIILCLLVFLTLSTCFVLIFFQRTSKLTKNSIKYVESFKRNDIFYSRHDRAFFKSVRPIIWNIGPWLQCDNNLGAQTIHFVIMWVINLLVSSDIHKYQGPCRHACRQGESFVHDIL